MPGFCNKFLAGFPHPQDGTALHKPAPNPSHSYLPLLCKLLSKTSCQIQPPNILPLVIQLSMINLFLLNPTNIPPWASSLIMTWSVLLSQTPLILIFQASISLSISCTFLVAIQSPRHVQLFATPPHPQTAACQASLSLITSQSLPKFMPIELMMPSNHFILCDLLFLPSTFPSTRVFSNESLFAFMYIIHSNL